MGNDTQADPQGPGPENQGDKPLLSPLVEPQVRFHSRILSVPILLA